MVVRLTSFVNVLEALKYSVIYMWTPCW